MTGTQQLHTLIRDTTRGMTRSRRHPLQLQLQVSGVCRTPQGREHLGWERLESRTPTKRSLQQLMVDIAHTFPFHEDVEFVLHFTRHNCSAFGETKVDVTRHFRLINQGE